MDKNKIKFFMRNYNQFIAHYSAKKCVYIFIKTLKNEILKKKYIYKYKFMTKSILTCIRKEITWQVQLKGKRDGASGASTWPIATCKCSIFVSPPILSTTSLCSSFYFFTSDIAIYSQRYYRESYLFYSYPKVHVKKNIIAKL